MSIKQKLYIHCQTVINNRLQSIQKTIQEIHNALTSETKSSAGDKHETGRAMLQLEREKAGNQLAEIEKTRQILSKINIENTSKTITLGSVVFTTQENYFIAISAGELFVERQKFYAISANSPIGQLLLGKMVGDEIIFRGQKFEIIKVL
jgi:transcription elongation GreA/GreB family factor